jgi:phosphoglycerol transferase MdoB-like AlkP superfamily enzyme
MVIIIATILRIGYKKERVINGKIFLINLLVATVLLTSLLFYRENIEVELRNLGIYHKKNANLPRRGLKYGYLTNFVQSGIFTSKSKQPEYYDFEQIQKIVRKYDLNTPVKRDNGQQKPDNIIVLLIESFTDPADFGWQFSTNPVATFHSLKESFPSGYIYSPVFGGKSINAEFELMTGMSNRFTPIESMPYQEFVKRNVPSLPRTFNQANYTSNTIQVVKFKGFGYGKIYEYLGVDNKISLADKEKYSLDPTGKFTSSEEIAKEIIALTNKQKSSFIFSFPNSSHSPWLIDNYPDTNIFLQNRSDTGLDNEISAYANAINHTDIILKNLIDNFRHSAEKTIIITMGDHQPGLHGYNRNYSYDERYSDYINMILKNYKVPISVWSNYANFGSKNIHMSMNLLPSYILDLAGIKLKGFMKFNNIVRKRMNVLTHIIQSEDGRFTQDLPIEYKDLINAYEVLQYDILFGENHLAGLID